MDEGAALGEDPDADFEGLGLGDGVVDHVDPARDGRRAARRTGLWSTPPDHSASSSTTARRGSCATTLAAPESGGEVCLGGEARHHRHLDVGVQGPQRSDTRDAQRAGAVDEGLAAGRWRMAQDGVHRHREGVGQHGQAVGHAVGDGDQHRVVGGEQVGPGAGGVGGHADVDTGAERAPGEAPTQIQVAGLARRAQRVDTPRARR